jgi:lipopolysaccharide/colanic/teichoic acid biosynthesis glycosyltransferase
VLPHRLAGSHKPVDVPSPASPFFMIKRWIDIFGSLALIVLLLPILLAGTFLVLLDVGLPILFWQERLGRNGRSFLIYKFRTLQPPFDRNGDPVPESNRLSAIGRFLRSTHTDELPQLLNVLVGDMSLIGPRPLLPEDQPANVRERLTVRPGMTGWAQVNGGKLVSKGDKEKFDGWYLRHASLRTDLHIGVMTLKILLKSHQPSEEALADAEQAQSRNVVSWRGRAEKQNAAGRGMAPNAAQHRAVPARLRESELRPG